MATRDRAARSATARLKENDTQSQSQYGKRQRTAAGPAARPPLSTASQNAAAPPPTEAPIEFAGREDVDALLNEKIKGKNKMDYKVWIFSQQTTKILLVDSPALVELPCLLFTVFM